MNESGYMREEISPHLPKASKSLRMKDIIEPDGVLPISSSSINAQHRVLIAYQERPIYAFRW